MQYAKNAQKQAAHAACFLCFIRFASADEADGAQNLHDIGKRQRAVAVHSRHFLSAFCIIHGGKAEKVTKNSKLRAIS